MTRATKISSAVLLSMLLAPFACGDQAGPKKPPPRASKKAPDKPEPPPERDKDLSKATDAAELANKIQADPDKLEEHLKAADMTPEKFDQVLFEIAEDPDLAEAYAEARTPMPEEEGDEKKPPPEP
jgi:hypothetical protein